ncbi:hypothetical protein MNB_SV-14-1815 [hydrothermal vent metagenome]|uniref:CobQ/CobB/MinD/ParA nucleotide binding domain-containing protein n=1 Tax=hydrothermal vent metagenome TaxID=652676 RepID=A0A1W1BS08_9ZZZZ
MAKIFIVSNTKGGTGKTTTALHILPTIAYLEGYKNINYYQLDDNNKVNISSKAINIKNYTINNTSDVMDKVELDIALDSETVNIIDIGGGNDTKSVLNYLKTKSEIKKEDITFFIPITTNLSQQQNLQDTIELIKDSHSNPKIILILNEVIDLKNYKDEFINIFGNEVYEIAPITDLIEQSCEKVIKIEKDNLYQVMEYKKKTLLDGYINALEIDKNREKLKQQYVMEYKEDEDLEAYYKKKRNLRFVQQIIDTVERFPKIA